jgi:4'-phosphopantetheinyl transferase EntD
LNLINRLVPPGAAAVEARGYNQATTVLFPEEEQIVENVSERRRCEFIGGRECAHRALQALGLAPAPVLRGHQREPIWPPGTVGSITHCQGYCAAVVARKQRYAAIGIDAELHEPLPEEVLTMVIREDEHQWVLRRSGHGVCWDRLFFSAKESVYKAWFTLTARWLGFEDVAVTMEPLTNKFHARFLVAGPMAKGRRISEFEGQYCIEDGLILTAVSVY